MYIRLEIDPWGKTTSIWAVLWSDKRIGKQNTMWFMEMSDVLRTQWKVEGEDFKINCEEDR